MSKSNITHNKRKINTYQIVDRGGSVGPEGTATVASDKSEPYLTITNKCTSPDQLTEVDVELKFSQIVDKINEDFHYFDKKNKYSKKFIEQFYKDPFFKTKIDIEIKQQILEESKTLYNEYLVKSVVEPQSIANDLKEGSIKCRYINDKYFSIYKPSNVFGNSDIKNDGHQSNSLNAAFQSANRVRELILANPEFIYFGTLTFDKNKVDSRSDACTLHRRIKRFFQRRGIRFILISELHEDGCVHFHGVFDSSVEPYLKLFKLGDKMSRKMAKAIKEGRILFNMPEYQKLFGFCDFELIQNKQAIANYVSKYIVKAFLDPRNRIFNHRYFASKGLKRPALIESDIPSNDGLTPHYSTKIPKFTLSSYQEPKHSNAPHRQAFRGIGRFDRVAGPPSDDWL